MLAARQGAGHRVGRGDKLEMSPLPGRVDDASHVRDDVGTETDSREPAVTYVRACTVIIDYDRAATPRRQHPRARADAFDFCLHPPVTERMLGLGDELLRSLIDAAHLLRHVNMIAALPLAPDAGDRRLRRDDEGRPIVAEADDRRSVAKAVGQNQSEASTVGRSRLPTCAPLRAGIRGSEGKRNSRSRSRSRRAFS